MKTLKNTTLALIAMQCQKNKKQVRKSRQALALKGLDLYRMLDRYKPVNQ